MLFESKPPTTIGEDVPVVFVAVESTPVPILVAVMLKLSAGVEPSGSSKETEAAPLLNALLVPTSVATTFIGAAASKKSFCDCERLPGFFPAAIVRYSTLFLEG